VIGIVGQAEIIIKLRVRCVADSEELAGNPSARQHSDRAFGLRGRIGMADNKTINAMSSVNAIFISGELLKLISEEASVLQNCGGNEQ